MRKFFTESVQKKELTEMAAPKMPDGVKRKRSSDYAHVHNIHIDGQHIATISGHRDNHRGAAAHEKIYHIHHSEEGLRKGEPHKDHSYDNKESVPDRDEHGKPQWDKPYKSLVVRRPLQHHSMQSAVDAVVNTHRNNEEFGHGHDPKVRWAHAIKLSQGHDDHERKTKQYATAISHAQALGHNDITSALEHHADAHAAKASKPSQDKLRQWTHDASNFTGMIKHPTKWSHDYKVKEKEAYDEPNHPDHIDMAKQAHNVHVHGHPEGSVWDRQRKTADVSLANRGHRGW